MKGYRRRCAAGAIGLGLFLVVGCAGMPGLLGRQPPTPRMTEGQPDAEALLAQRCTWCHTLDRVRTNRFDRAGWEATIDLMRRKGARLTDEERQALVDHLTRRDEGARRQRRWSTPREVPASASGPWALTGRDGGTAGRLEALFPSTQDLRPRASVR